MANLICTDTDFTQGAKLFRKEILYTPVKAVMDVLDKIATRRAGVRYEEKQFAMDADMQFGNYDPTRTARLDVNVTSRTLKTYFASARREFDPNEYVHTILSSPITKGEELKGVEVARIVLNMISKKLGDHLRRNVFSATRNDSGTTTNTLFNGYDTITANEITATNISAAKGNLYTFSAAIDSTNAVDALKEFVRSANDFLIDKPEVNLVMPYSVYYAYLDDYKATTGAIPYNREFNQYYIEGHENVRLVPMGEKKGSNFLHLTTKDNMLVGYNLEGEDSNIVVEKHDVALLTFYATMFFGVDFESLAADRLFVGKLHS